MGQKTHPLGFRLGITQEHRSAWYANFSDYASLLEEDNNRLSENNRIIEKGRKNLSEKTKKKQDLKQKTEEARKGKKEKKVCL